MPINVPGLSDFFNVGSVPLPPETEEERRRRLLLELGLLPGTDLPPEVGGVDPSLPPTSDLSLDTGPTPLPPTPQDFAPEYPGGYTLPGGGVQPTLETLSNAPHLRQRPRPNIPYTPTAPSPQDILPTLQPEPFPRPNADLGEVLLYGLDALPVHMGQIAVPLTGRLGTAAQMAAGFLGEPITAGDVLSQGSRALGRVGQRIGEVEAGLARDLGVLPQPTVQRATARRPRRVQPEPEGPLPSPRPPVNPLEVGAEVPVTPSLRPRGAELEDLMGDVRQRMAPVEDVVDEGLEVAEDLEEVAATPTRTADTQSIWNRLVRQEGSPAYLLSQKFSRDEPQLNVRTGATVGKMPAKSWRENVRPAFEAILRENPELLKTTEPTTRAAREAIPTSTPPPATTQATFQNLRNPKEMVKQSSSEYADDVIERIRTQAEKDGVQLNEEALKDRHKTERAYHISTLAKILTDPEILPLVTNKTVSDSILLKNRWDEARGLGKRETPSGGPRRRTAEQIAADAEIEGRAAEPLTTPGSAPPSALGQRVSRGQVTVTEDGIPIKAPRPSAAASAESLRAELQSLRPNMDLTSFQGKDTPKLRKALNQAIAKAQAEGRVTGEMREEGATQVTPDAFERRKAGTNRERTEATLRQDDVLNILWGESEANLRTMAKNLGVDTTGDQGDLVNRLYKHSEKLKKGPVEAPPISRPPRVRSTPPPAEPTTPPAEPTPAFAKGDTVNPVDNEGNLLSERPVRITDIQTDEEGGRWYQVEGKKTYFPEDRLERVVEGAPLTETPGQIRARQAFIAEGEQRVNEAAGLRREAEAQVEANLPPKAAEPTTPPPPRPPREPPRTTTAEPPPEPERVPEPTVEATTPPEGKVLKGFPRLKVLAEEAGFQLRQSRTEGKPHAYRKRGAHNWQAAGKPGSSRREQLRAIEKVLSDAGADTTAIPTTKAARDEGPVWGVAEANRNLPEGLTIKPEGKRADTERTVHLMRDGQPIATDTYRKAEGGFKPVTDRLLKKAPKGTIAEAVEAPTTPPTTKTGKEPRKKSAYMQAWEAQNPGKNWRDLSAEGKANFRETMRAEVKAEPGPTTPPTKPTPPQPTDYSTKPATKAILREEFKTRIRDFNPKDLDISYTARRGEQGREAIVKYRGATGQSKFLRDAAEAMIEAHKTTPEVRVVDNTIREAARTHGTSPTAPTPGTRFSARSATLHAQNLNKDLNVDIRKNKHGGGYTAWASVKNDAINTRISRTGHSASEALDNITRAIMDKRRDGSYPPEPPNRPPAPPSSTPPVGSPGGPSPNLNDILHKTFESLRSNLRELKPLGEERRAELSSRFKSSAKELGRYEDPRKAFAAAKGKLKGQLKKTTADFKPLDLTDDEIDVVLSHIQKKGMTTEGAIADVLVTHAIRAEEAFMRLSKGFMVNKSEAALLSDFFGPEFVEILATAHLTPGQRILNAAFYTLRDTARILVPSGDFGYVFRQGFWTNMAHPKTSARIYKDMLHVFGSETKRSGKKLAQIAGRKMTPADELTYTHHTYDRRHDDPYFLVWRDLGGKEIDPFGRGSFQADEQYRADSPVGRLMDELIIVTPSQRSFVENGNEIRFTLSKQLYKELEAGHIYATPQPHLDEQGIPYKVDRPSYEKITQFFNAASGQGASFKGKEMQDILSTILFAPRFLASRFETLGLGVQALTALPGVRNLPLAHKMDPIVRNEILKSIATTLGTVGGIVAAGKTMGLWDVETDKRSADHGKIRIGDWRYDPWGGYQQLLRYGIQAYSGEATALDTDEVRKVGLGETLIRFGRSKLNIPLAIGVDLATGETFTGKKLDGHREMLGIKVPEGVYHGIVGSTVFFTARDFVEVMQETDAFNALGSLPNFLGMGSTYVRSRTEDTPGLHMYQTADVFAVDLIADRLGDPALKDLLLKWVREDNTDRKADLAEKIDKAYNTPEGSTFMNLVADKEAEGKATLFGSLKRAIENQATAENPDLLTYLNAHGRVEAGEKKEPEKPKEIPEPKRAIPPETPDFDPWSIGYTADRMAAQYGPAWGFTNPHDKEPVAYNQLSPAAKRSIAAYISKLNAKANELFEAKTWGSLERPQKAAVLKAVGVGPKKPVEKKTDTARRKEELAEMVEKVPRDLETQRKQTKGR